MPCTLRSGPDAIGRRRGRPPSSLGLARARKETAQHDTAVGRSVSPWRDAWREEPLPLPLRGRCRLAYGSVVARSVGGRAYARRISGRSGSQLVVGAGACESRNSPDVDCRRSRSVRTIVQGDTRVSVAQRRGFTSGDRADGTGNTTDVRRWPRSVWSVTLSNSMLADGSRSVGQRVL